jgi:hypothetical protein
MDSAQADPRITFIVTFGHRPAYSSGHHPGNAALEKYLGRLGRSHDKYKLNLSGHSHDYERTLPQSGVIHITAGIGGAVAEDDPSGDCPWLGGCPAPSWSAFRAYQHGALRLSVTAAALELEAICAPPVEGAIDPVELDCVPGSVFDTVTIHSGATQRAPGPLPAPTGIRP